MAYLGLDTLYKEKIRRNVDSSYRTLIYNAVNRVIAGIRSESEFFARYFSSIHCTGSHWDNLDINKDDTDADVNIVLKISEVDVVFEDNESDYRQAFQIMKMKDNI